MGLQFSSLLVGDSRRATDTSGASGVTQLTAGDANTTRDTVLATGDSKTAGEVQRETQAEKAKKVGEDALPPPCGLDNDGISWLRKKPSQRKRITEATAEQQAKYRLILDEIKMRQKRSSFPLEIYPYSMNSSMELQVDFDPNDVIQIALDAQKYFESESSLIEDVPQPLTIVGDLHGQLYDLNRIFMVHEKDGKPGYESAAKFIFLGNYVDRGRQSLEVVMALFILKILYPDNFFLLRGNHEFMETNVCNGFGEECFDRFELGMQEAGKVVYGMINTTFAWLSLAAIVGGKYFLVHGGISATGFSLRNLRNLRKPILESTENMLVHDLVWSDPMDGLLGTCENTERDTSIYFGEDAFAYAMHKIGCLVMIRGHSVETDRGLIVHVEPHLHTLQCNGVLPSVDKGSFAKLKEDLSLQVYIMPVDETRLRIEKKLFPEITRELQKKLETDTEFRYDSLGSGTITVFNK